jgi:hypothetical protein
LREFKAELNDGIFYGRILAESKSASNQTSKKVEKVEKKETKT